MAKFISRQLVKDNRNAEVRTVEETREGDGEPMYSIRLGRDFASRIGERVRTGSGCKADTKRASGLNFRLSGSKKQDAQLCADVAEKLAKDDPRWVIL